MTTKLLGRNLLIGALSLLVPSSPALAQQATAQLGGRITDQSGAVLPGVTVSATQTGTGFNRSVVTDGDGSITSGRACAARCSSTRRRA